MKQALSGKWLVRAGLAVVLSIGLGGVSCWAEDSAQSKTGQPAVGCPGLSEAANQLITSEQKLAKTNHYIDFVYKTALSLAADELEKNKIRGEQCAWLDQINKCLDVACMSKKTDARLVELSDFNYGKMKDNYQIASCPEYKFMDHESDKEFCLSRLIEKKQLGLAGGRYIKDQQQQLSCDGFLSGLKSDNGTVSFVEPAIKSDSENNPLIKVFEGYTDHGMRIHHDAACTGFERYDIVNSNAGNVTPITLLYSNQCDELLGQAGISTHVRVLDVNTKKQKYLLGLSHPMPISINGLVMYNKQFYFFETIDGRYISIYLFDYKKSIFNTQTCLYEQN